MHLVIINASPRMETKSNTARMVAIVKYFFTVSMLLINFSQSISFIFAIKFSIC